VSTHSQGIIPLTHDQHRLLFAILKDCREFFPSRHAYDEAYKALSTVTLPALYQDWKAFNRFLVCGGDGVFTSALLPGWVVYLHSPAKEVRAMRQLLGVFSRLEGFCDETVALEAYRVRVSNARGRLPSGLDSRARDLIQAWLGPAPCLMDLIPRHGPGAVAESLKDPADKRHFRLMYPQLLPFGGSALVHLHDTHAAVEPHDLRIVKHPITRVIAVPKDFSKPRIISCEPLTMQFLQQGLCRFMMDRLEAMCPYVRFRDQSVNRNLARDLTLATLDLSDASDTVSRRHVAQLFPPDWRRLLFALRSHFAKLPDGTLVPLRSFAPMGSALCFPVEAVVFAATTVAAALAEKGEPWVRANKSRIAVYGDDIIVPLDIARSVMTALKLSGFKPNEQKCCMHTLFRESCGAEWWGPGDVTVVRPRTLLGRDVNPDRHTTLGEMPMVSHAKALYTRGFSNAAQFLASLCTFPVAIGNGSGYAPSDLRWPNPGQLRWNRDLQRCEQQALLPVQVARPSDISSGYSMLFMHLVQGWRSEQVSIPRVKPKNRWVLASPLSER
jgi:hypothetical protein